MKLNGPLTVRGYSISQVKLQPHNTQLRVYEIETILSDYAARVNGQLMTNWRKTLQLTR